MRSSRSVPVIWTDAKEEEMWNDYALFLADRDKEREVEVAPEEEAKGPAGGRTPKDLCPQVLPFHGVSGQGDLGRAV